MEAATDSDKNTTPSLQNYAHVYAEIHKSGIPDKENPMKNNISTTILTK